MGEIIKVGIADINTAKDPDVLVTYALGSCVGVCLYDPFNKVAGLAHVMLPSSSLATNGNVTLKKFADTAIRELIILMKYRGANDKFLHAKIAGGAQMFNFSSDTSISAIGERNITAVKAELKKYRIPIIAQDVGENYGRTQYFDASSGIMKIKSAVKGEVTY